MSKEKPPTDASSTLRAKEKKDKSSKKEKRSETSGVTKKSKKDKDDPSSGHKKERKEEKKKKKEKSAITTTDDIPTASEEIEDVEMTTQSLNTLSETNPGSVVIKDETGDLDIKVKAKPLLGALVPFAVPLVDEKVGKKVLKGVKKGLFVPCPLSFLRKTHYPSSSPPSFLKPIIIHIPPPSTAQPIQTLNPNPRSRPHQNPQTRRQRSRQSPPQIFPRFLQHILLPTRQHRHPSRRHLPHGRDIAPPRPLRGSRRAVCVCAQSGGVGGCGEYEEADECGYGGEGEEGEGGEGGGGGEGEGERGGGGGEGGLGGGVCGVGQGGGEGGEGGEGVNGFREGRQLGL